MLHHHPVLKTIIFRKADNAGLSHVDLSELIGDANTAKGSSRLADFRHTGRITNDRLRKLILALKIPAHEVNAALCTETILSEERSLAEWKERTKLPDQHTAQCNDCVFRSRRQLNCCGHPLLERADGVLQAARWIGYIRPDWCPAGYDTILKKADADY